MFIIYNSDLPAFTTISNTRIFASQKPLHK